MRSCNERNYKIESDIIYFYLLLNALEYRHRVYFLVISKQRLEFKFI